MAIGMLSTACRLVWLSVAAAMIFACSAPLASARDLPAVAPVATCDTLANRVVFAGDAPARIVSASTRRNEGVSPYCEVKGYVAPQVRFELRLPVENWHQRLLFAGCGGFCGAVNIHPMAANSCTPLDNGEFALVSSDLGHSADLADGVWASGNAPGVRDFGNRGVHVVTLAVRAIIAAYYGQAPKFSYFSGCSDGGREGLMEAQRYPQDFDGIVAGAPVLNQTFNNSIYHAWLVQHLLAYDGTPLFTDATLDMIHAEALRQCGANGGTGEIIDPANCHPSFARIMCRTGRQSGCIEPGMLRNIMAVYSGPIGDDGKPLYFGAPVGSEYNWNQQAKGSLLFARNFITYMTGDDPARTVDVQAVGYDARSIQHFNYFAADLNALNPDLNAFARHGGKLLIWHGWADASVPSASSLAYVSAVRKTIGATAADDLLRLYMLPGVSHCGGGRGPDMIDLLTPVMRWVEDAISPAAIVATAHPGTGQTAAKILPYDFR